MILRAVKKTLGPIIKRFLFQLFFFISEKQVNFGVKYSLTPIILEVRNQSAADTEDPKLRKYFYLILYNLKYLDWLDVSMRYLKQQR